MNWTNTLERKAFTEHQGELAARTVSCVSQSLVVPSVQNVVDEALSADSPIEAVFAVWFGAARDHLLAQGMLRFALSLRPQFWVEAPDLWRYRLDFALVPLADELRDALFRDGQSLRIGVELDGHDYHEKTREQVIARNRRDRDLMSARWRVLHFSGSELHRNPMAAVVEALVLGAEALDDLKASTHA